MYKFDTLITRGFAKMLKEIQDVRNFLDIDLKVHYKYNTLLFT